MRPRFDQKHAIDAVENRIAKRGTRYHHTITQVVQRVRNTGSPTCQGDKACLKGSRRCERLIDTTSCHVRGKTAAITCAFLALSGPRRGRQRLGGLARCHDTDDTNRGYGDTQTIRCMVKMAPFGRLSDENYELHDLAWKTDHEAAAMGLPNSPLPGQAWPQSKHVAGPVSRGCCWCN